MARTRLKSGQNSFHHTAWEERRVRLELGAGSALGVLQAFQEPRGGGVPKAQAESEEKTRIAVAIPHPSRP